MSPAPVHAEVVRVASLTPHMIRVVLGGDGLADFALGPFTDHYVKLQFPDAGGDIDAAGEPKLRTRTYTVRAWDAEGGELTIDFVHHGDTGVAGPWAASARPGDTLRLRGIVPGGAYAPDPAADWHLMVGDAAVVPAISASLAVVPAGVPVHVILQVEGPDEELALESPGDLRLTWLHGTGDEEALERAVRELAFPAGTMHGFVHGEASAVRAVRRHLLVDRAVPREALSVSGYWKRTRTEEGWREDKPEWNRLAEADLTATSGG